MSVVLRSSLYVVVGLGALVVYVPSLLADLSPGPWFFLGLPMGLLGLGLYLWTNWIFAFSGRGTAVPLDPPRVMVARGPYRVVRNPMAIGFVLIIVGEGVAVGSRAILVYAALAFIAIYLFVVFVEEPGLRARFGSSYEAYVGAVPRWLPRLRHPRKAR